MRFHADFHPAGRSQAPDGDLPGRRLPRTAAVLDSRASVILRQFVGGRGHYWAALDGALTPDQESALGSGENPFIERPVVRDQPSRLSEHDEKQLVDLAAAAELTPGRVSRRLTTLLSNRSAPGGR